MQPPPYLLATAGMMAQAAPKGLLVPSEAVWVTPSKGPLLTASSLWVAGAVSASAEERQGSSSVTAGQQKLKPQSREITKEEKQPASARSTPSSIPPSSPKQRSKGCFTPGSSTALPGPILALWILKGGIRTEVHQINGGPLNQDPSRSMIWQVMPFRPTEELRSPLQWN
ncbi:putative monooxygenase p33MONOX [Plecturocebus cupreus]